MNYLSVRDSGPGLDLSGWTVRLLCGDPFQFGITLRLPSTPKPPPLDTVVLSSISSGFFIYWFLRFGWSIWEPKSRKRVLDWSFWIANHLLWGDHRMVSRCRFLSSHFLFFLSVANFFAGIIAEFEDPGLPGLFSMETGS